ncbi:MAG: hypothetical protein AAFY13_02970, partial [Pseudomonadota bacterium]
RKCAVRSKPLTAFMMWSFCERQPAASPANDWYPGALERGQANWPRKPGLNRRRAVDLLRPKV